MSRRLSFATVVILSLLLLSGGCSTPMRVGHFFSDPDVRRLAEATARGDIREAERLIGRGTDVNARGRDNMTPLLWTMYRKNREGFRFLLENGADPNVVACAPSGCESVMHGAMGYKMDPWWLEMALRHGGDPNLHSENFLDRVFPPIFDLTEPFQKNRTKLDLLVAHGADLDLARGDLGHTPLVSAVGGNQYDVVFELLEMGANPLARIDSSRAPAVTRFLNASFMDLFRVKHRLDEQSHLRVWQVKVTDWLIEREYLEADFEFPR